MLTKQTLGSGDLKEEQGVPGTGLLGPWEVKDREEVEQIWRESNPS